HGLKGAYVPLAIQPGRIEPALRALHPLGYAGVNLTIPHKQEAFGVVDSLDPAARAIGAISCVSVGENGALHGSNNDWYGFTENILEASPQWRADAGPAAVLGAGGGARAVVYALAQRGAKEIRLINRTPQRAEALAREFGAPVKLVAWELRNEALEDCAMAVNATSQGMQGMAALDIALDRLPRNALAADIIYIPKETPFLAAARLRGNQTINGLGMLLHQGRPAWKNWFGLDVEVTPELRRLIEATI
ncbi:MAG: shikimate dehydrogenase, partial [Alphaproteobacteria bacterium]|nr:shikimate dehydrogenase [Alphaproteobacteria bacterium]